MIVCTLPLTDLERRGKIQDRLRLTGHCGIIYDCKF